MMLSSGRQDQVFGYFRKIPSKQAPRESNNLQVVFNGHPVPKYFSIEKWSPVSGDLPKSEANPTQTS